MVGDQARWHSLGPFAMGQTVGASSWKYTSSKHHQREALEGVPNFLCSWIRQQLMGMVANLRD